MKIDFEFDSAFGVFRDALYLPDDHTMSDTEIESLKQQRFDNWLAIINSPAPIEEIPDQGV